MNSSSTPSYYWANSLGRFMLLALEEVLGRNGLNAVLHRKNLGAFVNHYPPNNSKRLFDYLTVSQIHSALEEYYGPRGGRGISLRAVRAWFTLVLREFSIPMHFLDLPNRVASIDTKHLQVLQIFAEVYQQHSDMQVQVETQPGKYVWHVAQCAVCWERHSQESECHFHVGSLQEALYWASGGKLFFVEEQACCAKGDSACTFVIDSQAFG